MFSVTVANLGRKVVAVDASLQNLAYIDKSVSLNGNREGGGGRDGGSELQLGWKAFRAPVHDSAVPRVFGPIDEQFGGRGEPPSRRTRCRGGPARARTWRPPGGSRPSTGNTGSHQRKLLTKVTRGHCPYNIWPRLASYI